MRNPVCPESGGAWSKCLPALLTRGHVNLDKGTGTASSDRGMLGRPATGRPLRLTASSYICWAAAEAAPHAFLYLFRKFSAVAVDGTAQTQPSCKNRHLAHPRSRHMRLCHASAALPSGSSPKLPPLIPHLL